MAVDASSVSVVLGAPGQAGSPQVVTAAGLVFTQAPAPAATSAYWNYNGTNLVGNVPTTKGFSLTIGGTAAASLATVTSAYVFTVEVGAGTRLGQLSSGGAGATFENNQCGIERNGSTGGLYVFGAASTQFRSLVGGAGSLYSEVSAVAANPTTHVGQMSTAHISGGSTALTPTTCRIGLGAGTTSSGTAVTASGHDLSGRVGVTVNSTGTASQPVLLVSFATAYNTPPFIQLTPGNAATATQSLATTPFPVTTTTGFSIQANTTGMPAATYLWYYNVIQ